MEIRRVSQHTPMPWSNGRGVSHEITRHADDDGEWLWRVAIAPIVEDGPFSSLRGVHRELTLIEGDGLVLTIDGEQVTCPDSGVVRFSGSSNTTATLTNGPVVDLNVMSKEGHEMAMMITSGPVVTGDFVCVVALEDCVVDLDDNDVSLGTRDAIVGTGAGLQLQTGRFAVIRPRR